MYITYISYIYIYILSLNPVEALLPTALTLQLLQTATCVIAATILVDAASAASAACNIIANRKQVCWSGVLESSRRQRQRGVGVAGVQCSKGIETSCSLRAALAVARALALALVYAFIKHQTKSKTSRIHEASYIVRSSRSSSRILHVFCIQMQSRQLAIYAHNLSHKTSRRRRSRRRRRWSTHKMDVVVASHCIG